MLQTIKSFVLAVVFIGVGYGAHVVLNQPLDLGDSLHESLGANDPWGAAPQTPPVTWNDPAAGPSSPDAPSRGEPSPTALDVQLPTPAAADADRTEVAAVQPATAVAPASVPQPETAADARHAVEPESDGEVTFGDRAAPPAASSQGVPEGETAAAIATPTEQFAAPAEGGEVTSPAPMTLEMIRASIETKLADGELADALFVLSVFFADTSVSDAEKSTVLPLMDQLAGTVIYSRDYHLEQPHMVQPNETLEQIASRYDVPPMVLARINRLTPPYSLMADEQLKVVRGPFQAHLHRSTGQLIVYANRYYAGRFQALITDQVPDQAGTWLVADKRERPPYQDPATGQLLPPGDPQNPWGEHWVGLVPEGATQVQCALHGRGTSCPERDPRGFIALPPQDADDLYTLLSVGSTLTILR